ncbi:MAG: DciA family protein [Chloroflexota bacterium]
MTQPRRPMRRVGDVLPGVATSLGLDEQLAQALAMSSWDRLVAELVPPAAGASRLLEMRPGELLVAADDALTGQELRLNADVLLRAFANAPGGRRARDLRVIVRPRRPA